MNSRSTLRKFLLVPVLVVLTVTQSSGGAGAAPTEYEVKAAFLYNFAKFVQWAPASFSSPVEPILLGVVGADPFGPVLDHLLKDQMVDGRHFTIERFSQIGEARHCHMLFISGGDKHFAQQAIAGSAGWHALTVSDLPGFPRLGGMIGLVKHDNKLAFEINVVVARQAGLTISSKLLKLADLVGSKGSN